MTGGRYTRCNGNRKHHCTRLDLAAVRKRSDRQDWRQQGWRRRWGLAMPNRVQVLVATAYRCADGRQRPLVIKPAVAGVGPNPSASLRAPTVRFTWPLEPSTVHPVACLRLLGVAGLLCAVSEFIVSRLKCLGGLTVGLAFEAAAHSAWHAAELLVLP
jgi:hypothetical protein